LILNLTALIKNIIVNINNYLKGGYYGY